jgi:hypothetical protein
MTELAHTFPASALPSGHAYANAFTYLMLDEVTDVRENRSPYGGKGGVFESMDQRSYLLALTTTVEADGAAAVADRTTFRPSFQQTALTLGAARFVKRAFVPVGIPEPRIVHIVIDAEGAVAAGARVLTRLVLPAGSTVDVAELQGHRYLAIGYPFAGGAVLFAGTGPEDIRVSERSDDRAVEVEASYDWPAGAPTLALSFTYRPGGAAAASPGGSASASGRSLVGGLLSLTDASPAERHLDRLADQETATLAQFRRTFAATAIHTPSALVNRGIGWAKANQQRDQTEYVHGSGFTNSPPNDVVVARDSYFCLIGTNYHSQPWSRRLLELWFDKGMLASGKFVEYLQASSTPLPLYDYDLNINDDTPMMILSAHQYYALSGDRGFMQSIYSRVLLAADYILAQRRPEGVGAGLVFCESTEATSARGQATWRNVITGYLISGAVTEINAECLAALRCVAEIAIDLGDAVNAARMTRAADDLERAIDAHLRVDDPEDPRYLLMITPDGTRVADRTGDMLIPLIYGLGRGTLATNVVERVFADDFWAGDETGRGGVRTVATGEANFRPQGDHRDNYGLLGGLWPNVALWATKAAADAGRPDLALRALTGTLLLSEPADPRAAHVLPGEFPEYFNSDDLVQRGQLRSTFIPGIVLWVILEGMFGLTPAPAGIRVEPALPPDWGWGAIGDIPYRGRALSILVLPEEHRIITTELVTSSWAQTVVPVELGERYALVSEDAPFWLVVPEDDGLTLVVASDAPARGRLIERSSGAVVAVVDSPGGVARYSVGA